MPGKSKAEEGKSKPQRKKNPSLGRKMQGPSLRRSCLFKGLRRTRAIVGHLWLIKIISLMCKSLTWPPGGTHLSVAGLAIEAGMLERTDALIAICVDMAHFRLRP
jgi:hypothetical protein